MEQEGAGMTNRDALILALRAMGPVEKSSYAALYESPWDDFATPESIVAYGVACPHRQRSEEHTSELQPP